MGDSRERPILFSAPMVIAILDGSKTQTRRTVKPAKDKAFGCELSPCEIAGEEDWINYCPYGTPGNRLWVREAWAAPVLVDDDFPAEIDSWVMDGLGWRLWYHADNSCVELKAPTIEGCERGRYRHARFMPRWASRITLEITAVRVERLQDISEGDARAEGYPGTEVDGKHIPWSPFGWYMAVWDTINGEGSHNINPWVWVIEFRRIPNA